ncbi:MAG: hypothetical protein ACT4P6_10740 [Gemmatimonadaceae bacterium]
MRAPYRPCSIAAAAFLAITACENPAPDAIAGTQSLVTLADYRDAQQTTAPVMTHPSQGPVTQVPGAQAVLTSNDNGIRIWLRTQNLAAGNAHTLWWIVINEPQNCLTRPCSAMDVLTRASAVKGDIGYATGRFTEGAATFAALLENGPLTRAWFGHGLTNPRGAEVHVVLHDHGPRLPELARNMITTFRGGCTNASIPAAFPPAAFADGIPGPNTCRLVQVAILQQ